MLVAHTQMVQGHWQLYLPTVVCFARCARGHIAQLFTLSTYAECFVYYKCFVATSLPGAAKEADSGVLIFTAYDPSLKCNVPHKSYWN